MAKDFLEGWRKRLRLPGSVRSQESHVRETENQVAVRQSEEQSSTYEEFDEEAWLQEIQLIGADICGDIFGSEEGSTTAEEREYFCNYTGLVWNGMKYWLETEPDDIAVLEPELSTNFFALLAQINYNKHLQEPESLRSYIDAGIAAGVAERLYDRLYADGILSVHVAAGEVHRLVEGHARQAGETTFGEAARALHLAAGRIALRHGAREDALASAKRALTINAVCPDGQSLLFDALKAGAEGVEEPGNDPVDDIYLGDLSDRFCMRPFNTLVTGHEGKSFLCDCPAYLPFDAGNVLTETDADAIWNSETAQEIRRSILDGDFSYCSRSLCGMIREDMLPRRDEVTDKVLRNIIDNHKTKLETGPSSVQLSHDQSCNLACPSCRTEILTLKGSAQEPYVKALHNTVLPLLERTEGTVMVSGGGDPFGSKHYRAILSSLNPQRFKKLNIAILTNALLLNRKQWNEFADAHPMVGSVLVSVDAARPETYAHVRRPGDMNKLIPNLEFLAELRRANEINFLGLCFVVQARNFREMPEFVDLGKRLGVDLIWFQRIVNFGSFTSQEIIDADVAFPENPHHEEFKKVWAHPSLKDPIVRRFGEFVFDRGLSPDEIAEEMQRVADAAALRDENAETWGLA